MLAKMGLPAELVVTQRPACGYRRRRGFVLWSGEATKGQERTLNRRPMGDQNADGTRPQARIDRSRPHGMAEPEGSYNIRGGWNVVWV
jgi:hypothetical protein